MQSITEYEKMQISFTFPIDKSALVAVNLTGIEVSLVAVGNITKVVDRKNKSFVLGTVVSDPSYSLTLSAAKITFPSLSIKHKSTKIMPVGAPWSFACRTSTLSVLLDSLIG